MSLPDWDAEADDRAVLEARAREALFDADPARVAEAVAWFDRFPRASDRAKLVEAYGSRRDELAGVAIDGVGHDLATELGRVAAERWAGVHTGLRILLRHALTQPDGAVFLPVMERVDGDWVAAHRAAIDAALRGGRRPASPAPGEG